MHGTHISDAAKTSADDVALFLARAQQNDFLGRIKEAFAAADRLKIAFVGETIIDEYIHVKPLAKPSKEFILATVAVNGPEQFMGGVVAAAAQGEWPNAQIITINNKPITKTRYVDADFSRKLFEVYSAIDIDAPPGQRQWFREVSLPKVLGYDVVIVFDFGHGLLGDQERAILEKSKFLAVNAQTNAGNSGFNPVTKYKRADYVCVDEPEARLAIGNQRCTVDGAADAMYHLINCNKFIITRGRSGSKAFNYLEEGINERRERFEVPAFADHGVDTIGAGDAFLAVTAPLIAAGLDLEAAAFVGNVAGAIKIDIVGHRRHVTRDELMQRIEGLLNG